MNKLYVLKGTARDGGSHDFNIVILPVIFILQAFFLMIMMQCITFADPYVFSEWFRKDNIYFLIYNFLLCLFLVLLCYILFKKVLVSYLIPCVLLSLFSVVNNMKWAALNECVTVSDFSKLSEAAKVAGKAELCIYFGTWICMAAGMLFIFIWIYFDMIQFRTDVHDKKNVHMPWIFFAGLIAVLLPFLILDMKKSEMAMLTETRTADKTGPLVYFVESVLTAGSQKPYTVEEAESSYYQYVEKGMRIVEEWGDLVSEEKEMAGQYPNIIVIMSEAFYDVNQFEGTVSYSEDPMSAFEKVKEESSYGNVMVNVYGGSTHFSEFEFLTGWNTKGMHSGSCPYKDYFSKKQPAFAGYLKGKGYYTMAVHPYNGTFWDRYRAYPRMGFDKFIDRYQMTYTDMCGYISDDSLTNEIIYQYEKNKEREKPFFCFGVSIANHIAILNGEEKENAPDNIKVTFHDKETGYGENKRKWFGEYVSGIAKSGEALQKLTDYFDKQKVPTVIVFFGDHAPSYALDLLRAGNQEESLAYSTPYIIWDNFGMDKEKGTDMNVSFLSAKLLMKLGMPLTTQCYYNIGVSSDYPVETRYIIEDKTGRHYQDFDREEKKEYYSRALDLKKHTQTLLENPSKIEGIWE